MECQQSLDILNQLAKIQASRGRPEFQRMLRDLGYNYLDIARNSLASGSAAEGKSALGNLSRLLPRLSEADRTELGKAYRELEQERERAPKP